MTEERLNYLFQRFFAKTLTEEERQEFFLFIRSEQGPESLKPLIDQAWTEYQPDIRMPDDVGGQIFREITTPPTPVRRLRTWLYAAAIAALLIASGGYLFFRYQAGPGVEQIAQQQDAAILPGSNKAILTLADGSTVTLDSSVNQVIRQGNAAVYQQQGQLQYKTTAQQSTQTATNTLTTPRGSTFRVTLPDGTRVWLNSASSLQYPMAFNGGERVVTLRGQGYFEVMQNARQPFRVKANGMEVTVLGTSFDIMAYADENAISTTLVDGAVKVTQGTAEATLKPGQQAVLNEKDALSVHPVDVNQVIAWKTGFFEFANTDLATIMRQIARWYDVEVVFENTPSNERFLGRIGRDQPLSRILQLLEENGIQFRVTGKKIMVLN
jgi:transmembrane sensor